MIITEISPIVWDQKTNLIGFNNFFQTIDWLNVVAKHFELINCYFEIKENNSIFYFSFQKNKQNVGFCPFIGYGEIISSSPITFELNRKIVTTVEKHTNCKIARMKLYPLILYEDQPILYSMDTTSLLPIQKTIEAQEALFHKKTRTAVRNAQKKGVTVKPLTLADLPNFYSLYLETAKRVHSEYITPYSFFADLITLNNTQFLGAYYQSEIVAGSVFLSKNRGMFYWWNASGEKGNKLNANYAILFEAIIFAIQHSITFLDMASSHTQKIQATKLRWGAHLHSFYIAS